MSRLRWMRRKVSRVRWFARLFGIPLPKGHDEQPGIILIQIDGLSRTQFDRAVKRGRLPFLARAVKKGRFHELSFYSGIPSTTPAVQGEIFYGVKAAVPAFEFLDRKSRKMFRMFDADAAKTVEEELARKGGAPLLANGHSYSNIYRAGASGSWYCSQDLSPSTIWEKSRPLKWLVLSVIYLPKIIRVILLSILEFLLAVRDCFTGLFAKENLKRELLFVPARISICIMLREFIRFRVLLDIERGVPILHANFLGYDEQSHRRGPDSEFAHWTLKGIDRAIRDIHRAARRSDFRDYEMIIFSDHGQEKSIPYEKLRGRPFEEAVKEVFKEGGYSDHVISNATATDHRVLGASNRRRILKEQPPDLPLPDSVVIAAMGPLGHIYLPDSPVPPSLEPIAATLRESAGVPLVMIREMDPERPVKAFTRSGMVELPRDGAAVLGKDHPFLTEATADLTALARHPNAGDLIVSGWSPEGPAMSFPPENGAHGGPGSEETRGFLLLPDHLFDEPPISGGRDVIRGEDIHQLVHRHFHPQRPFPKIRSTRPINRTLRVMTYNIHSCVGIDGKLRPERIARVINRLQPDIIAVQEVDAHRLRSRGHDQAEIIAGLLEFRHAFHSMLEEEKEKYGIALFSGFPFEVMKSGLLTKADPSRLREARGAIWIKTDGEAIGTPFHFINSHFGLGRDERTLQASTLMNDEWLGNIPDDEPVILCGDFNSTPRSPVLRGIRGRLPVTGPAKSGHRSQPTFPSLRPVAKLDHVFASRHFKVREIIVPTNHTATIASDHLPLCVELELEENA
ncbi:MAG TPA: endonuclease/exonuclease/phosphatase family protein [Luteolibacter sp.]|nr:endonuclease/exonuclease/phosphatase family protein [Luteolibacter sp.]